MIMRDATCVGTHTSKVPTQVALLFVFYSVVRSTTPATTVSIVLSSFISSELDCFKIMNMQNFT